MGRVLWVVSCGSCPVGHVGPLDVRCSPAHAAQGVGVGGGGAFPCWVERLLQKCSQEEDLPFPLDAWRSPAPAVPWASLLRNCVLLALAPDPWGGVWRGSFLCRASSLQTGPLAPGPPHA